MKIKNGSAYASGQILFRNAPSVLSGLSHPYRIMAMASGTGVISDALHLADTSAFVGRSCSSGR
jgi:hypothetical protein